jgi:hypothetical protein
MNLTLPFGYALTLTQKRNNYEANNTDFDHYPGHYFSGPTYQYFIGLGMDCQMLAQIYINNLINDPGSDHWGLCIYSCNKAKAKP